MREYKIVVAGSGGVGKSAITLQFVKGKFVENYDPTIEDSYRKQTTVAGEEYILEIVDTAGQEEYTALRDFYLREGDGYMICYSIVQESSLYVATQLRKRILRMKDEEEPPMLLIANKLDLAEKERQIPRADGESLANSWNFSDFVEMSARRPEDVNEAFQRMVLLINKYRNYHNPAPRPSFSAASKSVPSPSSSTLSPSTPSSTSSTTSSSLSQSPPSSSVPSKSPAIETYKPHYVLIKRRSILNCTIL